MTTAHDNLPAHLRHYVVEQNYARYTAIDQAVWRFIMRQLKNYLVHNAHPIYAEGLEKTGISTEHIPDIAEMSKNLESFGWRAIPVSGFIPPAAFMELQSLGVLPIASDMRTVEHLTYTPAPDIVHEAAGHAPILIDPEFSAYLKKYAQVARKSILNHHDLEVYEAIRELSDLKEDPTATEAKISQCYARLEKAKLTAGEPSEAALLARMNWWTAEYGLIGTLERPKIYGAGLMSSVDESRSCLMAGTRKIPFSLECLNYNYDITEPQPQIFVTPSFAALSTEIEKLALTMAFRQGGKESLDKIIRAATVNTAELDSGLQISGKLIRYQPSYVPTASGIAFLKFDGPCQLNFCDQQLSENGFVQGTARHAHGFSSPIGYWKNTDKNPSDLSDLDLSHLGIVVGANARIETVAGVVVEGRVHSLVRKNGKLLLITLQDCTVRFGVDILFQPEWGDYDMAVGTSVPSVFGGPADREAFGNEKTFSVARVPVKVLSTEQSQLNVLYVEVRKLRETILARAETSVPSTRIQPILQILDAQYPAAWLIRLEIYEIAAHLKLLGEPWVEALKKSLNAFASSHPAFETSIHDGLKIAHQLRVGQG